MVVFIICPFVTGSLSAQTDDGSSRTYRPLVESHLRLLTTRGLDNYGPRKTAMWMAVIDTRMGRHPESAERPKRVYREIGAPRGSTLYWDQSLLTAACRLSELTGDIRYRQAVDQYIRDFLEYCVDQRGIFQWGNHCYYDVFADRPMLFSGGYHELRPHTPRWDLFWQLGAHTCDRYIRRIVPLHLYDAASGGFNRHDNRKREHAFLEAGAVLVESLAWLYSKTNDQSLVDQALTIAGYSYRHRGEVTGLVVNNPDGGRWDSKVCTTEIAVWASSLLRAADYTGNPEFAEMARESVSAYLKYGYDEATRKYFGQLSVADGSSVVADNIGYWPRKHSEIWNPDQWPTHDYPMEMAAVCLVLFRQTGADRFREAVERWAEIACRGEPSERTVAYAGQYGKCISFLLMAAEHLEEPRWRDQAQALAGEAVDRLYENGWFQGYAGSHLYESVDGVGDLLLALLELEVD